MVGTIGNWANTNEGPQPIVTLSSTLVGTPPPPRACTSTIPAASWFRGVPTKKSTQALEWAQCPWVPEHGREGLWRALLEGLWVPVGRDSTRLGGGRAWGRDFSPGSRVITPKQRDKVPFKAVA